MEALLSPSQWASPVGLGTFLLSLSVFIVCASRFISLLAAVTIASCKLAHERPAYLPSLRYMAGLLAALSISAVIMLFHDQIRRLEGLGYFGAFLMMVLLSAALLLPSPTLVLNFVLGQTLPHPLATGLAVGLGLALGELTGYLAGQSGSRIVTHTRAYRQIERGVHTYGLWVILGLSFVPNPIFDVAGIVAGALGIGWGKFLLATAAGRTVRSIAIAYAGAHFLG